MEEGVRIDYVEIPGRDAAAMKRFYGDAFGWSFTDYGPSYAAFDEGLDGGLNCHVDDQTPSPLVILYADDLDAMADKVRAAGGEIIRGPYDFPGGRRFHFKDPSGNELAVWSDS